MASASQIKGITIKIEGDTSPLAKDLQNVNKDINQTQKALKDVEAALKLDPTNVELLAQKQELLNKQIEQTNEKLELERQAGEDAREALEIGSISQEEYATLQAEIVKTETSLNNLQTQADGSADALGQTGEAAAEAGEQAEDSSSSFESWGAAIEGAAEAAAVAIAAVTAAVVGTAAALSDATLEASKYADEVNTLSIVTGVSTETIQALNYATELLDVSTETITGSMSRLLRNMSSAKDGTGSAAEAFAALGVSITDSEGNLRDNEDVFWDIIDALGDITNEAERDALAMDVLGRSARDLNPLIEAGSEEFERLRQEAIETGYVLDSDQLDGFQNLDDNMQRLKNGATAARNAIGRILLPVLTQLSGEGVDLLNEFTNAVIDTDGDVSQLGAVIDEMVPRVLEILDTYLPVLVELGGSIIGTLASSILDNLPTILQSGADLLFSIAQGIIDHLSDLAPVVSDLIVNLANFIVTNLPTVINSAIQIVVAVVDGISQALPELIPAAVDCVNQICVALIDNLDLLVPAALELMLALGMGLVAAIPDLLAMIPTIANAMRDELTELGPSIVEGASQWGVELVENFINGVTGSLGRLRDAIGEMGGVVYEYLHHSTPDKGPLADDDEWGSDFMENWINGMESEMPDLEAAVYQTGSVIAGDMNPTDYTGVLSGISSQLGSIGASGRGPYVFNVYIGQQRFATQVVDAIAQENYLGGGT